MLDALQRKGKRCEGALLDGSLQTSESWENLELATEFRFEQLRTNSDKASIQHCSGTSPGDNLFGMQICRKWGTNHIVAHMSQPSH